MGESEDFIMALGGPRSSWRALLKAEERVLLLLWLRLWLLVTGSW